MSKYNSAIEAMERLIKLIKDPQPGLLTWVNAVAEARSNVLTQLMEKP